MNPPEHDFSVPVRLANKELRFPDPRRSDRDGMLAIGGDLAVSRLLLAYRSGIFPWTVNPVTWWSPDPRAIFELDRFHVSHSLARVLRRKRFQVTVDRAFRQVMEGCAAPAPGRRDTWITREFIEAYPQLLLKGHSHSFECWDGSELAGGIYGVAIGGFFAGESMFHRVSDASKVALYYLVQHLRTRGFGLFDIQMLTPVTRRLGGIEITREEYLKRLSRAVRRTCEF